MELLDEPPRVRKGWSRKVIKKTHNTEGENGSSTSASYGVHHTREYTKLILQAESSSAGASSLVI